MTETPKKETPKKKWQFPGLIGILEFIIGRGSDSPNGERKSWGTTMFYILAFPAFITAIIVPVGIFLFLVGIAYGWVDMNKAAKMGKMAKSFLGWPLVSIELGLTLIGLALHLMRKESDRKAAMDMADAAIRFKHGLGIKSGAEAGGLLNSIAGGSGKAGSTLSQVTSALGLGGSASKGTTGKKADIAKDSGPTEPPASSSEAPTSGMPKGALPPESD